MGIGVCSVSRVRQCLTFATIHCRMLHFEALGTLAAVRGSGMCIVTSRRLLVIWGFFRLENVFCFLVARVRRFSFTYVRSLICVSFSSSNIRSVFLQFVDQLFIISQF